MTPTTMTPTTTSLLPCSDDDGWGSACRQMKEGGHCNNPRMEQYTKTRCRKTCGYCGEKMTPTPPPRPRCFGQGTRVNIIPGSQSDGQAGGWCGETAADICNGGRMKHVNFDNGYVNSYNWKDLEACDSKSTTRERHEASRCDEDCQAEKERVREESRKKIEREEGSTTCDSLAEQWVKKWGSRPRTKSDAARGCVNPHTVDNPNTISKIKEWWKNEGRAGVEEGKTHDDGTQIISYDDTDKLKEDIGDYEAKTFFLNNPALHKKAAQEQYKIPHKIGGKGHIQPGDLLETGDRMRRVIATSYIKKWWKTTGINMVKSGAKWSDGTPVLAGDDPFEIYMKSIGTHPSQIDYELPTELTDWEVKTYIEDLASIQTATYFFSPNPFPTHDESGGLQKAKGSEDWIATAMKKKEDWKKFWKDKGRNLLCSGSSGKCGEDGYGGTIAPGGAREDSRIAKPTRKGHFGRDPSLRHPMYGYPSKITDKEAESYMSNNHDLNKKYGYSADAEALIELKDHWKEKGFREILVENREPYGDWLTDAEKEQGGRKGGVAGDSGRPCRSPPDLDFSRYIHNPQQIADVCPKTEDRKAYYHVNRDWGGREKVCCLSGLLGDKTLTESDEPHKPGDGWGKNKKGCEDGYRGPNKDDYKRSCSNTAAISIHDNMGSANKSYESDIKVRGLAGKYICCKHRPNWRFSKKQLAGCNPEFPYRATQDYNDNNKISCMNRVVGDCKSISEPSAINGKKWKSKYYVRDYGDSNPDEVPQDNLRIFDTYWKCPIRDIKECSTGCSKAKEQDFGKFPSAFPKKNKEKKDYAFEWRKPRQNKVETDKYDATAKYDAEVKAHEEACTAAGTSPCPESNAIKPEHDPPIDYDKVGYYYNLSNMNENEKAYFNNNKEMMKREELVREANELKGYIGGMHTDHLASTDHLYGTDCKTGGKKKNCSDNGGRTIGGVRVMERKIWEINTDDNRTGYSGIFDKLKIFDLENIHKNGLINTRLYKRIIKEEANYVNDMASIKPWRYHDMDSKCRSYCVNAAGLGKMKRRNINRTDYEKCRDGCRNCKAERGAGIAGQVVGIALAIALTWGTASPAVAVAKTGEVTAVAVTATTTSATSYLSALGNFAHQAVQHALTLINGPLGTIYKLGMKAYAGGMKLSTVNSFISSAMGGLFGVTSTAGLTSGGIIAAKVSTVYGILSTVKTIGDLIYMTNSNTNYHWDECGKKSETAWGKLQKKAYGPGGKQSILQSSTQNQVDSWAQVDSGRTNPKLDSNGFQVGDEVNGLHSCINSFNPDHKESVRRDSSKKEAAISAEEWEAATSGLTVFQAISFIDMLKNEKNEKGEISKRLPPTVTVDEAQKYWNDVYMKGQTWKRKWRSKNTRPNELTIHQAQSYLNNYYKEFTDAWSTIAHDKKLLVAAAQAHWKSNVMGGPKEKREWVAFNPYKERRDHWFKNSHYADCNQWGVRNGIPDGFCLPKFPGASGASATKHYCESGEAKLDITNEHYHDSSGQYLFHHNPAIDGYERSQGLDARTYLTEGKIKDYKWFIPAFLDPANINDVDGNPLTLNTLHKNRMKLKLNPILSSPGLKFGDVSDANQSKIIWNQANFTEKTVLAGFAEDVFDTTYIQTHTDGEGYRQHPFSKYAVKIGEGTSSIKKVKCGSTDSGTTGFVCREGSANEKKWGVKADKICCTQSDWPEKSDWPDNTNKLESWIPGQPGAQFSWGKQGCKMGWRAPDSKQNRNRCVDIGTQADKVIKIESAGE